MTDLWILEKGWAAIVMLSGLAATLVGVIWQGYRMDVKALHARIDGKADRADVDRHEDEIQTLFDRQREDNGRLVEAVQSLSRDVNKNHNIMLVEIGKRPTRDELKR